MRCARCLVLAAAVIAAAGEARGGDPDVADLLLHKAKKALASKNYDEAEAGFRRAIKEMAPNPEARLGLGETLDKLGRSREALATFRACIAEIDAEGEPARWRQFKRSAQREISKIQRRYGELNRLNEAFIRKCLAFGKKRSKSDPTWARRAFETVLQIDPGNTAAEKALAKLPEPRAAPPSKSTPKPARAGENVFKRELWDGNFSVWDVEDDRIVGDAGGRTGEILWLWEMPLERSYSFRAKYRLMRQGDSRLAYGMFLGGDAKTHWWGIIFDDDDEVGLERIDGGTPTRAKDRMLTDFDHKAWHTIEVVVEPGELKVSLDGTEILTHSDERRAFDGVIGFFVQDARIEWKEIELCK